MGAKSRFEQPLTLLNGGSQVVACGPLLFFWDDVLAEVNISLISRARAARPHTAVFVNHDFDPKRRGELVHDEMMTTTRRVDADR